MFCLKKRYLQYVLIFCSLFTQFIFSAEVVRGDIEVPKEADVKITKTFSFPIEKYAVTSDGDQVFVSAHSEIKKGEDKSKNFSVSVFHRASSLFSFRPLILEKKVKDAVDNVNEENIEDNPLFDVGIKHLALLERFADGKVQTVSPVVVTSTDPSVISIIRKPVTVSDEKKAKDSEISEQDEQSPKKKKKASVIISNKEIRDAEGNKISSVDCLAAGGGNLVFAAVKGFQEDVYGEVGSGIALMEMREYQEKKPEDKEKQTEGNNQETNGGKKDNQNEKQESKIKVDLFQGGNAVYLGKNSDLLTIGNDVSLSDVKVSDMYWDSHLKCLFIALHVVSDDNVESGAKALLIGRFEDFLFENPKKDVVDVSKKDAKKIKPKLKKIKSEKKERPVKQLFVLRPFASDSVFEGQDKIIGATGKNCKVSLHKVRTMFSSNCLSYAIVLGGNGGPDETRRSVYALPLSKNSSDKLSSGLLASKDARVEYTFKGGADTVRKFSYRSLKKLAKSPEDSFVAGDDAVTVGAGPICEGDISEISVAGDAVFALVSDPDQGYKSGLFMSHALFDKNGKVKRWTKWRRVVNSVENIYGTVVDDAYGSYTVLSGDSQNDVKTVKRTVWGDGQAGGLADLISILGEEFPKENAGIQGLFEFENGSCGSLGCSKSMALLVATGFKKIALVQMGYNEDGKFKRTTGDFSLKTLRFNSGEIVKNPDGARVIVISGGVLDKIGPIETAEISYFDSGRLFVGGAKGLAVLIKDNNSEGWSIEGENCLGRNFSGLSKGMRFNKIGNYSFIKKIIADGQFLYILTDTGFDRIDLADKNNNFKTGKLKTDKLVSLSGLNDFGQYGTFLDVVVSGKMCLLATSVGLYRIANGQDISKDNNIDWVEIDIPSYDGPISQLVTMSKTLKEQDFAKQGSDGMVYVVGASITGNIAQINRFSVSPVVDWVDDEVVVPFPDFSFEDTYKKGMGRFSSFVNYLSFRKCVQEFGAFRFSVKDNLLQLLRPNIRSSSVFPTAGAKNLKLSMDEDFDIVKILHSVSGPILIAGNFGLKVNE